MNIYTTDKIRNVVLLGHGGCGKTSLAEAMAYLAGLTTRMGIVADGNTISDYDKEENKRQFSIHTSVIPIPWGDVKVNILDTPGYFDFIGEAEEAVSAAELMDRASHLLADMKLSVVRKELRGLMGQLRGLAPGDASGQDLLVRFKELKEAEGRLAKVCGDRVM